MHQDECGMKHSRMDCFQASFQRLHGRIKKNCKNLSEVSSGQDRLGYVDVSEILGKCVTTKPVQFCSFANEENSSMLPGLQIWL
jgi:hypothetical protein